MNDNIKGILAQRKLENLNFLISQQYQWFSKVAETKGIFLFDEVTITEVA